jgi:hypothetical protein
MFYSCHIDHLKLLLHEYVQNSNTVLLRVEKMSLLSSPVQKHLFENLCLSESVYIT